MVYQQGRRRLLFSKSPVFGVLLKIVVALRNHCWVCELVYLLTK